MGACDAEYRLEIGLTTSDHLLKVINQLSPLRIELIEVIERVRRPVIEHVRSERIPAGFFAFRRRQQNDEIRHIEKDRKSTRLNSSHVAISYAVFCLIKQQ